jgi:hypothetical protein
MTTILTVEDARKLLRPPLRFGDPQQIEAVQLLESLETLRNIMGASARYPDYVNCPECDGSGRSVCPNCGWRNSECEECQGRGRILTRFLTAEQLDSLLKYAERNNHKLGMTA